MPPESTRGASARGKSSTENRRGREGTEDRPGGTLPASISKTGIPDRRGATAPQNTTKTAVTTKKAGRSLRAAPGLLDRKVGSAASRLGPRNRATEGASSAVREVPLLANLDRRTKLVLNPKATAANRASRKRVQEAEAEPERSNGKAESDLLVGPEIVTLWYKWSTRGRYGDTQVLAVGSYIHLNYRLIAEIQQKRRLLLLYFVLYDGINKEMCIEHLYYSEFFTIFAQINLLLPIIQLTLQIIWAYGPSTTFSVAAFQIIPLPDRFLGF